MHSYTRTVHTRSRRGNVLVVALVLTMALGLMIASLMNTLVVEKHINEGAATVNEARNVAEAATEVAVAEINRRGLAYTSLLDNPATGFAMPSDAKSHLATDRVSASSIDFKVGELSDRPNTSLLIDAADPFNTGDPDKSKRVMIRHGYVYGTASATDPKSGRTVSSHVATLYQVREQNWLDYAIFYNLDLEMHSGSAMNVTGPIHSNANIYVTSGAGEDLRCYSTMTTTKKIIRGYKYGGTITHTGSVYLTRNGSSGSPLFNTMSTTQDSKTLGTGFKTLAESRWSGFVQDQTFSVPTMTPPGLLNYVPDDYATTGVNEMRNHAYVMIEPQLSTAAADVPANNVYSGNKGTTVENMKFSGLAGLTIRLTGVLPAAWSETSTNPGFELVYYTGSLSSNRPLNRSNLPTRGGDGRPTETVVPFAKMKPALLARLNRAIYLIRNNGTGAADPGGIAVTEDTAPATTPAILTDNNAARTRYAIYDRRQGYNAGANNGRKGTFHLLNIDMLAFDAFLESPAADWVWNDDPAKKVYDTQASYNNIIYVQCPLLADTDAAVIARKTTDKIRPARISTTAATLGFAVLLRRAGTLPQLASDPSRREDGLTFATNGPLYIQGNYNADGLSGTGSSTSADTGGINPPNNTELASLVAADAVTLLSSTYADTNMRDSWEAALHAAAFTEVSTAILAGIVPTKLTSAGVGSANQWAGGVHNYVRFLEDWTGDEYRYRGSITCLFESEVATGPWYQGSYTYWYQLPTRNIGYHQFFADGFLPPGMPGMRTVRRIAVADISSGEYEDGPPKPDPAGL